MEIQRGRKAPKLYPLLINCFFGSKNHHMRYATFTKCICDISHMHFVNVAYPTCDISHMRFVNVAYCISDISHMWYLILQNAYVIYPIRDTFSRTLALCLGSGYSERTINNAYAFLICTSEVRFWFPKWNQLHASSQVFYHKILKVINLPNKVWSETTFILNCLIAIPDLW